MVGIGILEHHPLIFICLFVSLVVLTVEIEWSGVERSSNNVGAVVYWPPSEQAIVMKHILPVSDIIVPLEPSTLLVSLQF
jgi:hypothetical protein